MVLLLCGPNFMALRPMAARLAGHKGYGGSLRKYGNMGWSSNSVHCILTLLASPHSRVYINSSINWYDFLCTGMLIVKGQLVLIPPTRVYSLLVPTRAINYKADYFHKLLQISYLYYETLTASHSKNSEIFC